jgi:hypothetical protein
MYLNLRLAGNELWINVIEGVIFAEVKKSKVNPRMTWVSKQ